LVTNLKNKAFIYSKRPKVKVFSHLQSYKDFLWVARFLKKEFGVSNNKAREPLPTDIQRLAYNFLSKKKLLNFRKKWPGRWQV
jgi:hypothetical protein